MGSSTAFMLVEKKFKARNKIRLEFYILTYTNEPTTKQKKTLIIIQKDKYNGYPYCLYACGEEIQSKK